MTRRDYYDVLGVSRDADDIELKRAFRERARRYHPDVNPGDAASEDRFKEANEAYAVLSNRRARARYDRYGFAGVGREAEAAAQSPIGAVVDMVDELFGDFLRKRRIRRRGRDLRYTLEVSFEEAALGCEKTIRIPRGEGERSLVVTIPPGTVAGTARVQKGEGEPGHAGGATGDLHVIVRVAEHPMFRREGHDVVCEVPVSFSQAALGAVVEVPTLDGVVRMRIPESTQSGRAFRMRGRGVPRSAGKSALRGDQIVHVIVETPQNLTPRQRRLFEQLEHESGGAGDLDGHPEKQRFVDRLKSLFG